MRGLDPRIHLQNDGLPGQSPAMTQQAITEQQGETDA
jgi:hypothetical protein